MTILNVNNKCFKINETKPWRLQEEVEKLQAYISMPILSVTDRNRISKDTVDLNNINLIWLTFESTLPPTAADRVLFSGAQRTFIETDLV